MGVGSFAFGQSSSRESSSENEETLDAAEVAARKRLNSAKKLDRKAKRKRIKEAKLEAEDRRKRAEKKAEKNFEKQARAHRKRERMKKKKRYTDPSYFGHKRKPKRRPPGKRRLCKECGIVH